MENKKKEYEEIELARIKLDFKALQKWKKPNSDDLPICSFLDVYEACGLETFIKDYCKDGKQIIALDNLACNFYTIQRIKNFIQHNWETYSLDIDKDNHVFWDTSKWTKGKRHYAKKVKAIVRNSLLADFANFSCGLDEDLPDNVIVFRYYQEKNVVDATVEDIPGESTEA